MKRITLLACLVTSAASLGACGGNTSPAHTTTHTTPGSRITTHRAQAPDDAAQIQAAVSGYAHALAIDDGSAFCALLTDTGRAATAAVAGPNGSCAAGLDRLHAAMPSNARQQLLSTEVTSISVTGTSAVAHVRAGGVTTAAHLRKHGGKWLIVPVRSAPS
jgi:hypothetical protein